MEHNIGNTLSDNVCFSEWSYWSMRTSAESALLLWEKTSREFDWVKKTTIFRFRKTLVFVLPGVFSCSFSNIQIKVEVELFKSRYMTEQKPFLHQYVQVLFKFYCFSSSEAEQFCQKVQKMEWWCLQENFEINEYRKNCNRL